MKCQRKRQLERFRNGYKENIEINNREAVCKYITWYKMEFKGRSLSSYSSVCWIYKKVFLLKEKCQRMCQIT
jgi:hypothetical protein